ncbi:MAG: acyl-CoA reductase [Candidatus Tyrphobacter sp.]
MQPAIVERTGYSPPVVEYALDRLFESITPDAIANVIAREWGGREREPAGRVVILSSRTTVGVAIVPAIFAICAGCDVTVKDREDALVGAFFETLAHELHEATDDDGQRAFRAETWQAGEHNLSRYDAVVVFGNDETLTAVRAQIRPNARFIGYGSKASIGYVAREALTNEVGAQAVAAGAARDFILYDGEGCLSLHALFVERGGAVGVERFMEMLAQAARRAAIEFPLGLRDARRARQAAAARDLAAFAGRTVYFDPQAAFVIESGDAQRPPAFAPRVLDVHAVDSPREMLEYVRRHTLPIELCAVAGERVDVADAPRAAGANGITAFGEMQNPPLSYRHGGRPRFADFVK